ncbi:MAG: helix-turn-helix domain-containing protein [Candidatus Paceibacterota bacterium]
MNNILIKLGIPAPEADIYLSLLHRGGMKIAEISRVTGINRPRLYRLLPQMIEDGFVSEASRGKQKIYVPAHPVRLRELHENLQKDFEETLPDLEHLYEGRSKRPLIRHFSGKNCIKKIFHEMVVTMKPKDTVYRYSSPPRKHKGEDYLPKGYREIRDKKQLERLVISGAWYAEGKKSRLERHIKILTDFDERDFEVTTLIYKNKVIIIDYGAESGILIESAEIARFQRAIFMQLYKRLN